MAEPVNEETSQAVAAETDVTGPAATEPADAVAPGSRYRGWYWLGILIQVLVWTLIWLGIAIAVGVGGELTEFRYVGF